jgi:hypothetical protein
MNATTTVEAASNEQSVVVVPVTTPTDITIQDPILGTVAGPSYTNPPTTLVNEITVLDSVDLTMTGKSKTHLKYKKSF